MSQSPNKDKPEVFNYYIDQWIGRLGNNLFQLAHATAMAYKYGGRVTYKPHETIESVPIAFGRPQDNLSTKIVNDVGCFTPEDQSFAKKYRYDMLKKFGSSTGLLLVVSPPKGKKNNPCESGLDLTILYPLPVGTAAIEKELLS